MPRKLVSRLDRQSHIVLLPWHFGLLARQEPAPGVADLAQQTGAAALKCLIQPKVLNELLKTGLGRNLPAMPAIVKDDPVLVRGPASGGIYPAGSARPDGTNLLDLEPGLCPGPERACVADGLGRNHEK
jgi:hypothetical protein